MSRSRDRARKPPARESVEPPPRQALQQRVAAAILQAGARTFASLGDRANLADVAVTAGVARATVYRYFPNRRRLLDELARMTAEDVHARLILARIDEVPVEEGLGRAVRAFVDVGDGFVVLVRERARADGGDFEELIATPVRKVLEAGVSAGAIRRDVSVAWLFESLIGLVTGALRHGSLGPDDTVSSVTTIFLTGVRSEQAQER
jgi:TetR/AcrR family transcriptional regulator, mexCD-oprJ operon repressor